MSIWKYFENEVILVKDLTLAIHYMQSFDYLVFSKQILICLAPLWFFVSILISYFGYIIWWYLTRWPYVDFNSKSLESRLEALSRKIISFEHPFYQHEQ